MLPAKLGKTNLITILAKKVLINLLVQTVVICPTSSIPHDDKAKVKEVVPQELENNICMYAFNNNCEKYLNNSP